jgi:transcriptional regulator with GAF, ATPase, and Fis domain
MSDGDTRSAQKPRHGGNPVSEPPPTGVFALGGAVIRSTLMREVLDLVARIAPSDASVLLTGESGVGHCQLLEMLAQLMPRVT